MFVQAKAGHAQGSTTERYLHATRTAYPDAAELAEARLFALMLAGTKSGTKSEGASPGALADSAGYAGCSLLPGLDSNQQPSG